MVSQTKLELSMALLYRENRRHGTDGRTEGRGASLNAAPREGHTFYQVPIYGERKVCQVYDRQTDKYHKTKHFRG